MFVEIYRGYGLNTATNVNRSHLHIHTKNIFRKINKGIHCPFASIAIVFKFINQYLKLHNSGVASSGKKHLFLLLNNADVLKCTAQIPDRHSLGCLSDASP